MSSNAPANLRRVVVEGLQKIKDVEQDEWAVTIDQDSGLYTVSMTLDEDELMWLGLWDKFEEFGFATPNVMMNGGTKYQKSTPEFLVKEHNEVLVVADDQASTPTTIKINETLISHANSHHVPPLEFRIDELSISRRVLRDNRGFCVTFERTVRMPDDNKLHHLPSSLGRYELFSVDAYSKRLPQNVREAGGVFFSMWQREAMWLNFQQGSHKYAVRVFVGHVNAITGKEMHRGPNEKDESKLQDYVVIPGQQWLDGICVAPGIVRQFVAMPLGSGYTVEGQKTSEEKHGGLQLEVTPEMIQGERLWSYAKRHYITFRGGYNYGSDGLKESYTPRELGCKIGDVLRSYPSDKTYRTPFRIRDLITSEVEETSENKFLQNTDPSSAALVKLKADGRFMSIPTPMPMLTRPSVSFQAFKSGPYQGLGAPPTHSYPEPPSRLSPQIDLQVPMRASPSARHIRDSIRSDFQSLGDVDKGITMHAKTESEGRKGLMELTETQVKNIKTMGLAAGGKLIQDIYKDTNPATTWNHAAARIIHVHMLDPESCEKVTHIVPRPPPMDVKRYAKTGGQFWVVEEKVDERLDGGDFNNVKSVSQMDKHVGITTEPEFNPVRPKMCTTCEMRLCDCIVRPCAHQFCNTCIKAIEEGSATESDSQQAAPWKCPTCSTPVSHVAGFSAPMNLPGEEPMPRTKVFVNVLKVEDGRARFTTVQKSRV
ncbi:hypothetical protein COCC4DRAFT_53609 [Bipolaris maydis ATCC 48331]|nr:uncharacterized protein COCC4DRAFT_53609 [Bipolaris maydis ATCC 48331]ENI00582.1 hypothetical protein COCC4DRAFT_53609 [Bipolaris maydis ATCC 48331]KAJ5031520.1 hypothetical protein J3E73DRAFT_377535 [Bipolaris maydis]KAJ6273625.1 hypothetical protein PSV08DRAFT_399796 [Bipolaris maydis]